MPRPTPRSAASAALADPLDGPDLAPDSLDGRQPGAVRDLALTGPTIAACRERYRRWLRSRNLRPATVDHTYLPALERLERYLLDTGMPTTIRSIRREHVESYIEWLADQPGRRGDRTAGATLSLAFRSLLPFWRWAVEREEIDASPMAKMQRPIVDEQPKPVLTADQLLGLLKTVRGRTFENRRDRAIMLTLLDTGMRRGELAGLAVEDLDFTTGRITVRAEMSKSRRTRIVAVSDRTIDAIDAYLTARSMHPLADRTPALWLGIRRGPGGRPARDDDRQDAGPLGALSGDGIRQMIERRARQAGIGKIHPHLFRHTFADRFLRAGGSEGDLMALGGWRDIAMVRHYGAALAEDRANRAHARFSPVDSLLGDRNGGGR